METGTIVIEPNGMQRAVIALFLAGEWRGTEDQIYTMDEVHEAFNIDEIKPVPIQDRQGNVLGMGIPDMKPQEEQKFNRTTMRVTLTREAAEFLLTHLPGAPCPSSHGPAKAKFLRALRVHIPKKKTESAEDASENPEE